MTDSNPIAVRNPRVNRQAGLSLVEIMVVLTLSVSVIGVVSQVFLSVKRSHISQTQITTMQANARHALQVLSENIRMAGYIGENQEFWNVKETADSSQKLPATIADECFTTDNASVAYRWVFPIMYNDGGTAPNIHFGPMLYGQDDGSSFFSGCIKSADRYQSNTDTISSHFVGPKSVPDAASGAGLKKKTLYARVSLNGGKAFFCDSTDNCVPTDGVSGELNYPIQAVTFFVSSCAAPGPDGACGTSDDIPGLMKIWLKPDGTVGKTTVAEGVVDMQVRYGLDSSGDGLADQYVDGDVLHFKNKAHWKKMAAIKSVRIWLLMRGNFKESGFGAAKSSFALADQTRTTTDGYRYQLYDLTVSIRNG